MRHREVRPSRRKVRVEGDRLLQLCDATQNLRCLQRPNALPALQVEVVGLHVFGRPLLDPLCDLGLELRPQGTSDVRGDIALDLEYVLEIAVVTLAPQVRVGRRLDQLRRHPHPISGAPDGA